MNQSNASDLARQVQVEIANCTVLIAKSLGKELARSDWFDVNRVFGLHKLGETYERFNKPLYE